MHSSRWLMTLPPPLRTGRMGQPWTLPSAPPRLRRWVGSSVVSAAVLLVLGGCNPVDDRLWPSIRPPAANRPAPADSAPFFRLLPGSIWEWTGVFSLLMGAGGVGFVYWRFPGLREEFSSLRDQTRRLHERRDRSTADLAQMARNLRDLEQEITVLRGELSQRDRQAPMPPPSFTQAVPTYEPPAPRYEPPAPRYEPPASPSLTPVADPPHGPSPISGPPPELPHFSPPSPPGRSRPRPIPQPDGRRQLDDASSSRPAPPPLPSPTASPLSYAPPAAPEAPIPFRPQLAEAPSSVSLLSERPDPEAAPLADAGPDVWRPQPGPGLDALIVAINSRGQSPIEGVTCVELDIAPPPEDGGVGYGYVSPRLRMVARGGRFLLVMVEGDAWLFPTIDTLDRFVEAAIEPNLFQTTPDSIERPQLILPAMLREVGGLWEVTDPGKVLLPAR